MCIYIYICIYVYINARQNPLCQITILCAHNHRIEADLEPHPHLPKDLATTLWCRHATHSTNLRHNPLWPYQQFRYEGSGETWHDRHGSGEPGAQNHKPSTRNNQSTTSDQLQRVFFNTSCKSNNISKLFVNHFPEFHLAPPMLPLRVLGLAVHWGTLAEEKLIISSWYMEGQHGILGHRLRTTKDWANKRVQIMWNTNPRIAIRPPHLHWGLWS